MTKLAITKALNKIDIYLGHIRDQPGPRTYTISQYIEECEKQIHIVREELTKDE